MNETEEAYRVLKINGLTKKVLLEINSNEKLYKKYDLSLFDENVREDAVVYKYKNIDDKGEYVFITQNTDKEVKEWDSLSF